jgi:hypothetical protein
VPHQEGQQYQLVSVRNDEMHTAVAWHSSRKAKATDEKGNPVYSVDTDDIIPEKDPVTGDDIPVGSRVTYVGGNLSMVMPTGFQWHKRGLALNLSHFFWNDSGLLSVLEEEPYAALVSPAPTVFSDNASDYDGEPRAGAAAGGLMISPDVDGGTEPGLYINEGDGLRIFGLDDKTPSGETTDARGTPVAERIGRLEIMYGPGFRMRTANSGTEPQYLNAPVDKAGALVPNDGRGLRVHGVTKKMKQWSEGSASGEESYDDDNMVNEMEVHTFDRDIAFQKDGRLVFNDKEATYHRLLAEARYVPKPDDYYITSVRAGYRGGKCYNNATRQDEYTEPIDDCEYTVPILVPVFTRPGGSTPEPGEYYKPGYNGTHPFNDIWRPVLYKPGSSATVATLTTAMETFIVMFMHISKSGLVLGVDTRETSSKLASGTWDAWTIPRFADK